MCVCVCNKLRERVYRLVFLWKNNFGFNLQVDGIFEEMKNEGRTEKNGRNACE